MLSKKDELKLHRNGAWISLCMVLFLGGIALFVVVVLANGSERVEMQTPDGVKMMNLYDIGLPRNLEDGKVKAKQLGIYYGQNPSVLLVIFAVTYVFKQTFSIPGSAILNVISGAIFGWRVAFPLTVVLTATGATCCYCISSLFGPVIANSIFGREKIKSLKKVVDEQHKKNNLFFHCLSLRVFPFTPNFFINMSSPLVGIPVHIFTSTVFFGLMPYNYLTVSAGEFISQLGSVNEVIDTMTMLQLIAFALILIGVGICKSKIQKYAPATCDASNLCCDDNGVKQSSKGSSGLGPRSEKME